MNTDDFQCIRVSRSDAGFATLQLHRPDKLNTLSKQLRREFAQAVATLEADPAVRVLILTGVGRAFTAGMDLDEWGEGSEPAAGAYDADPVSAILSFSGPVIGAINGLAITGGVEIAMACDLLVASTAARFADTHAQVGLLPGWGGSVRMVQRIGLARAKELALTGRFLGADEALAWGFVNHVVPPEQLLPKAEELARQMAATVPDTLVAYKKLLDAEAATTLADGLRIERETSRQHNSSVGRAQIDERLVLLRHRKR